MRAWDAGTEVPASKAYYAQGELYMDRTLDYLTRALETMRSCVVVMKYTKDAPVTRTKLDYISDNVQQLGMNLASLRGGFRLPKDYIHPEDRNGFVDAVSMAAETKTNFTCRVRLVGDDGVIRNVDVTSEYIDYDGDYYMIEYVFREVILQDSATTEKAGHGKDTRGRLITKDIFRKEELGELFGFFANAYGLYSTVVDQDGHALFPPVGPEAYLGHYYDMFERPENKELLEAIKRSAMMQDTAVYMEIPDGNPESRVSAVPLMVSGVYLATWMLYAHDKSQTSALRMASREQYRFGELVSAYIQKSALFGKRTDREKEIEEQLDFEIRQKYVLAELQDLIRGEEKESIHTIIQRAAEVLKVDYAFLMHKNRINGGRENLSDAWSISGGLPPEWNHNSFLEQQRDQLTKEGYVVDQRTMTNQIRVTMFQGIARAAILMPVPVNGELIGRVVFMETRKERIWTDSEVHFARLIGRMLGETIEYAEGLGARQSTGRELLDIFHQLTISIFIKDNETGKVLFSNDAINRRLGMDLRGQDSRKLIPDGKEIYDSYPGTVLENEAPPTGIRNWRRYIHELGGIYDVTEIPIEWLDGKPATTVLLRVAQD